MLWRTTRRPGHGLICWPVAAPLAIVVALAAMRAVALDGRVDLSGNWQAGGAGSTEYSTSTMLETYRLGEHRRLAPGLQLAVDMMARRQWLESTTGSVTSKSHSETQLPSLDLTYSRRGLRLGLGGLASRRDDWGVDGAARRDEYLDGGGWLRTGLAWSDVEVRFQERASWRGSGLDSRHSREHTQSGRVEVRPLRGQELRYSVNHQIQEAVTERREVTYLTQDLHLRLQTRFAADRGRASLHAQGGRFDQTTWQAGSGATVQVPPLWIGYSLDDSPELQDPLEDEPLAVPELSDGDRDTPTVVNIGDDTPPVRQYGGDYRNLILDLGVAETVSSIVIYADRRLRFPGFLQWAVHVSDDPEGRVWGDPLPAGAATISYTEMPDDRQGWLITFPVPISHRRFKLVDSKLGITEPDLFLTEIEVYQPASGGRDVEQGSRLLRHRLQGDVHLALPGGLGLRYGGTLAGKEYDTGDRDVRTESHHFGADWRIGGWVLAASQQLNRVANADDRDTDTRGQQVAVLTDHDRSLRARAAWSRLDDRSYTLANLTTTWTGDVYWQIAPRLSLSQKVSHGRREVRDTGAGSRSWVSVTDLHGAPRPNLDVVLRRADRWVSDEAGAGFTSYNDTDLTTHWAILPLVSLTSEVSYQERDGAHWLLRHTASWTPLPGGSVALRFYGLDLQDTRSDYAQRGGGAHATWKARPRLRVEGGAEWTRTEQSGATSTPAVWNLRGTWSF